MPCRDRGSRAGTYDHTGAAQRASKAEVHKARFFGTNTPLDLWAIIDAVENGPSMKSMGAMHLVLGTLVARQTQEPVVISLSGTSTVAYACVLVP